MKCPNCKSRLSLQVGYDADVFLYCNVSDGCCFWESSEIWSPQIEKLLTDTIAQAPQELIDEVVIVF